MLVSSRYARLRCNGDDVLSGSLRDRQPYLPTCGDEVVLQQMLVVRLGHRDTRMTEDLRQLVDVAARLQPSGAEGVTQRVWCDVRDLRALGALRQDLA